MDPNFKGLLQNFCQKNKDALPRYSCAHRAQDGKPFFLATVTVMGRDFASEREFNNKKQAEKSAAKVALRELQILPEEKSEDTAPSVTVPQGSYSQETSQAGDFSTPSSSMAGLELKEDKTPSISSPKASVASSSPTQISLSPGCGTFVSFKNVLQERAQKMKLPLPRYEIANQSPGFVCTVTFNGQCYKSEGISPTKKQAEQNAASVVVDLLSSGQLDVCGKSPAIPVNATTVVEESPTTNIAKSDPGVSYKNLLQEHFQQRGSKPPTYTTAREGSGFISTVDYGSGTAYSKCTTGKKQAEQMAAREALLALGINNPEECFNHRGSKKRKIRKNLPQWLVQAAGHLRTTWVHPHGGRGPNMYEHLWGDFDEYWEQPDFASKRIRFDETPPNKRSKFEATTFGIPMDHRRDLTVAEIWKEKKNIAIVGDSESSFILYCTRVPGTCNIFNTRTMSLVRLEPGLRIIGLDAMYADQSGKVVLQAERCADIVIPDTPDPVLTSCGVVLLYKDSEESSVQVLLKRYLSSQAFVNVAAALAQYFRRKISGRAVSLDVPSVTEYIHDWMQQEVQNIATMNTAALRQVFAYMWKFNEKWCAILESSLPHDLQLLQSKAVDELARRQASEVKHAEDFYHPWSLPKGNFKHRMLSTGLFIEPAINCAVRELKEETGIRLDVNELKNCPWIDLPQSDNFYNPHKGDAVRYFLYAYRPDTKGDEDELDTSQQTDTSVLSQTQVSIDEAEATFSPKFPSLDTSTEQDSIEEKIQDTQNTDSSVCQDDKCQTSENQKTTCIQEDSNEMKVVKSCEVPEAILQEIQSSQEKNAACLALLRSCEPSSASDMEQQASSSTNTKDERRGVKRKRDDDDDDDEKGDLCFETPDKQWKELDQEPITSNHEQCQSTTNTPASNSSQEVITANSPHVQGGVHEECSWFPVEDARVKSPAFEQVYQTMHFQEILSSLS